MFLCKDGTFISLLYGLPKHMISSLQSVQNTAARIVTLAKNLILLPRY